MPQGYWRSADVHFSAGQAAIIQRCYPGINSHFEADAVHRPALLLLQVRRIEAIQVRHFNSVRALLCRYEPVRCRQPVEAAFDDKLPHLAHRVGNPAVHLYSRQRGAIEHLHGGRFEASRNDNEGGRDVQRRVEVVFLQAHLAAQFAQDRRGHWGGCFVDVAVRLAEQRVAIDKFRVRGQYRIDQVANGAAGRAAQLSGERAERAQVIVDDRLAGDAKQSAIGRESDRGAPVVTGNIFLLGPHEDFRPRWEAGHADSARRVEVTQ